MYLLCFASLPRGILVGYVEDWRQSGAVASKAWNVQNETTRMKPVKMYTVQLQL
jgi:hypothetical protein